MREDATKMIKGLLIKDLIISKKIIIMILVAGIICIIPDLVFDMKSSGSSLGILVPGLTGLLLIENYNDDEKAQWERFIIGMGVNRNRIVASKYCLALLPLLVLILGIVVSIQVVSVQIAIVSNLVIASFLIPILYLWGRRAGLLLLALFLFAISFFQQFLIERYLQVFFDNEYVVWDLSPLESIQEHTTMACVISIGIFVLSFFITRAIVKRKKY